MVKRGDDHMKGQMGLMGSLKLNIGILLDFTLENSKLESKICTYIFLVFSIYQTNQECCCCKKNPKSVAI
jgi:hypothetical protein